jgi:ABC-type nitrate/sulfonate/bicarbonate transport system ATPase subunit
MRTRVALARSFVSRPEILFLDEPFTGLDLGWRESLYRSLQDLRIRFGTTVLIVTHDLEEAVYNSDRVLVMSAEGRIREEIEIPGGFPRAFRFGETVSRHTDILERLAGMLSSHHEVRIS